MLTHKERILRVMRGEMVDVIPYVPRLDLWWLANVFKGTLPKKYAGMKPDDISRAEGWACYHMVPNFADVSGQEDILHRSIGLFNFKQSVYGWKFSPNVEVKAENQGGLQVVEYHTPLGVVRTVGGLTEEMKKAGASLGWVQEHLIKKPEDYRIAGYIFENIEVFPKYEGAQEYMDQLGDWGVYAAGGPSLGASPMHLIQKELLDATRFFYEYRDHYREMQELAEKIGIYFEKVLRVIIDSPAQVVLWGANYNDMLTYPPFFEKEILPWLRKAGQVLGDRGKIVATHTDGENFGLMDLIRDCGAHLAESVTPYPMTKVRIEEYYRRWRDKLVIMGGIPESILLEETATREEFEAFFDNLFKSVAPGDRLILGPADSTPPNAVFDRLLRIGESIEKEGRLPLIAGSARPVSADQLADAAARVGPQTAPEGIFRVIQEDVICGDEGLLKKHAGELLEKGVPALDILHKGMIPAMERIGERFKTGEVFIPEVLLAGRAMNEALAVLEPHLAAGGKGKEGKVLIGTVLGDLHDIGKNMVAIMLRGVGFEIRDLGVNVTPQEFVRQVEAYQPQILALSALLTTTMPEMKKVIEALKEKGLREKIRVIVGGAPVNQKFAKDIGADGYARDAGEAVPLAKRLLKG
jgi:corrinoid protein of di/trimethylamine methyltransferase